MVPENTRYKIWDSNQDPRCHPIEVSTDGWLEDVIVSAGITYPDRAEFWCDESNQWIPVTAGAVRRAARAARNQCRAQLRDLLGVISA